MSKTMRKYEIEQNFTMSHKSEIPTHLVEYHKAFKLIKIIKNKFITNKL